IIELIPGSDNCRVGLIQAGRRGRQCLVGISIRSVGLRTGGVSRCHVFIGGILCGVGFRLQEFASPFGRVCIRQSVLRLLPGFVGRKFGVLCLIVFILLFGEVLCRRCQLVLGFCDVVRRSGGGRFVEISLGVVDCLLAGKQGLGGVLDLCDCQGLVLHSL